jgi:3-mercaptopyruvate sulfurtransferase SseA
VARTLIQSGVPDVHVLRGGWRAWRAAGYAVESGSRF